MTSSVGNSRSVLVDTEGTIVQHTDGTKEMGFRRLYHVDLLAIFFGIGTWVVVNGLWVELPLLVQVLPEGWNLPSFLTIIVQISNLAPLSYTILNGIAKHIFTEVRAVYLVICIGLIANGLLIFYWDYTSYVFGATRSTALFGLALVLAMVDTSSRVLYVPFMARFKQQYLTSYFIGEGLSGLVPSIFALIQGVGGNHGCQLINTTIENSTEQIFVPIPPNPFYSVSIFFLLLMLTVAVSLVAFHLLRMESVVGGALAVPKYNAQIMNTAVDELLNSGAQPVFYQSTSPSPSPSRSSDISNVDGSSESVPELLTSNNNQPTISNKSPFLNHLSKGTFMYYLVIAGITACLAHGTFPSIQSYSMLPYGNVAYHWGAILSTMSNPAVCFLLFILPKPSKKSITIVLVLSLVVGCYVMATAVMSPTPPLVDTTAGAAIVVFAWILMVGMFTYIKVSAATLLREEGQRGLFWYGASIQIGGTCGGVTMFFLVNYAGIFKSYDTCANENYITMSTAPYFVSTTISSLIA